MVAKVTIDQASGGTTCTVFAWFNTAPKIVDTSV